MATRSLQEARDEFFREGEERHRKENTPAALDGRKTRALERIADALEELAEQGRRAE